MCMYGTHTHAQVRSAQDVKVFAIKSSLKSLDAWAFQGFVFPPPKYCYPLF
jgi:hypothetical protein